MVGSSRMSSKQLGRSVEWIVLHHSASDFDATIADIERWHRERGFDDIGYHWVIDRDGLIWEGRSEQIIGAHARGLNAESLGVCCIGNFETSEPTPPMVEALIRLLVSIAYRYQVSSQKIIGHQDVCNLRSEATPTECPGKQLAQLLPMIRERVAQELPGPGSSDVL